MRSKGYLVIKDVAEAVGCHPKTVRNWINDGYVTVEKVSNTWFILADSVAERYKGTPIAGDIRTSLDGALRG
jgi:predicted site-specific integrase-resolvase